MSFEDNIQKVINELPNIISDIMLTIANDAKALIQQRVQQLGLNANGNPTPEYSESYKKVRQRKGLQVDHMDLTNTGEMWRSTGIVSNSRKGENIVVSIAGRDVETQNKINWASEKQFEVLKLTKEEEQILDDIADQYLTERIITILNE